jgi:hypothetical protein
VKAEIFSCENDVVPIAIICTAIKTKGLFRICRRGRQGLQIKLQYARFKERAKRVVARNQVGIFLNQDETKEHSRTGPKSKKEKTKKPIGTSRHGGPARQDPGRQKTEHATSRAGEHGWLGGIIKRKML